MSQPTATAPQDQDLPVGADALQQRDATDVMRMLFRSECFVEDLDDAYLDVYADAHSCAVH